MALERWIYNPPGIEGQLEDLEDDEYTEYKESGKESYSPGASTANRMLICNWDVRADFIDDLLGYSYLDITDNVHRVLPDEHPEIDNFFAEDATVEGKGVLGASDNDSISWTLAYINVNYKPRSYALLEDGDKSLKSEQDRFTSRLGTFAAEFLTINARMQYHVSGRILEQPPGKIVNTQEILMTWHEVPALEKKPFIFPNLTALTNCYGKVNSTVFDPNGYAFPIGTVLFLGVDPKFNTPKLAGDTATTPIGNYFWDLTLKFLYKNNGPLANGVPANPAGATVAGHNYLYDIQGQIWDLVETAPGTGRQIPVTPQVIYENTDLNSLWTIG
jgi:hypothetical protein